MQCPKCGAPMDDARKVCDRCGYTAGYGGNTVFYQKAAASTLTLQDVFSDVFKHHTKKDGERIFLAGTSLTTPSEGEMLSQWRKPYLFARVCGISILLILVSYIICATGISKAIPLFAFVGSFAMPVAILLFFWELNIPRNIPLYEVLLMLLAGGVISLLITSVLYANVQIPDDSFAAFIEEPAKLLALCVFLRKPSKKFVLNGILIGAAIGAGFAAMESFGYAIEQALPGYYVAVAAQQVDAATRAQAYSIALSAVTDSVMTRGILSWGGHVAWAAMYGGALALLKGSDKLKGEHFLQKEFWIYFGSAMVLHFIWNSNFVLLPLPIFVDLKYILLIVAAWLLLLSMMKKGVQQVLTVTAAPIRPVVSPNPSVPYPAAASAASYAAVATLIGVSGMYQNTSFPLSTARLVIGRDSKSVNIVFPPSTPGISSVHCEIHLENGCAVLVDRDSSYGTFLANGAKLAPNQPYVLHSGEGFYLANRSNEFKVQ